jgi:para-nitrobenzyl esterase
VILGTNKDENKLFVFPNPLYVKRWLGVVPRVRDPDLYLGTTEAMSAMWKATGADKPAAALRSTEPRVFVYRFDWDEEPSVLGLDLGRFLGAAHGFEIPFVFGHFDLGRAGNAVWSEANRAGREALAERMMSYWAQFAHAGEPGRGRRGELPLWTAWDGRAAKHNYAILDTDAGGGVRMGSEPVTVESVLASVSSDPRLAAPRARCWALHELAAWSRGFTRAGYDARPECADFPFDEFPW